MHACMMSLSQPCLLGKPLYQRCNLNTAASRRAAGHRGFTVVKRRQLQLQAGQDPAGSEGGSSGGAVVYEDELGRTFQRTNKVPQEVALQACDIRSVQDPELWPFGMSDGRGEAAPYAAQAASGQHIHVISHWCLSPAGSPLLKDFPVGQLSALDEDGYVYRVQAPNGIKLQGYLLGYSGLQVLHNESGQPVCVTIDGFLVPPPVRKAGLGSAMLQLLTRHAHQNLVPPGVPVLPNEPTPSSVGFWLKYSPAPLSVLVHQQGLETARQLCLEKLHWDEKFFEEVLSRA